MKSKMELFSIKMVVIFFILIISLASCSNQNESVEKVKISINSWIGWAPLYLAIEKNMLIDRYGTKIDLQLVRIEDTGTRKNSMITGRVDGYASSVDNFALDASQGVPGKIVMCFDESNGGDGIVAKNNIKTIKDLKGKTVAVQPGLPGHFLLLHLLKENGLSVNDVRIINMDSDKAGAAFVSGKLDAAVTWEPWLSKANEMADGHKLITTKELPGLIVDVLVFQNPMLGNTKVVNTIIGAWFKALNYWKMHKSESDSIMAKSYNLDVATFTDMCSGVRFYDLKLNQNYFGKNDTEGKIYSVFQSAIDVWKDTGLIKKTADINNFIDPDFIRKFNLK